mgnify:CR=1 FL=1
MPRRRAASLVGDGAVAHDAVRHRNLDVVACQDAGTPESDLRDDAALTRVEDDVVPGLVGSINDNGDASEEIGQRILGRETDRDADDAGRGQPGGRVDAPDQHEDIRRQTDQEYLDGHREYRDRAFFYELEAIP